MKEKEKKITRILRIFMMLLTCILIALFFGIMILVSDMQGTARVVNYAGLVRGKTQQIIKLENAQRPQDEMIREVDAYIDGLRHGSDELNLVRLDDKAFQDKMEVQEQFFEQLKEEIYKAREEGYENTQIINKSETFFTICDETTGLAESYSQKLASSLNRLEKIVVVDIIGIVCLLGYELSRHCDTRRKTVCFVRRFIWMRQQDFRIRISARRFWHRKSRLRAVNQQR